jgi:hypothetical protein
MKVLLVQVNGTGTGRLLTPARKEKEVREISATRAAGAFLRSAGSNPL